MLNGSTIFRSRDLPLIHFLLLQPSQMPSNTPAIAAAPNFLRSVIGTKRVG